MNMERTDEEDISITWFRQGLPEAFKAFFFLYYPELFSFAFLLVRDAPAAYQLSLDAFFLCWQRRADFTDDEKIKAFLYLTTRNSCMDHLRHIADPAVTDRTVPAGPPPDSIPPAILREVYAFASVGLKKYGK
jgi:DNA-directed RNA polymerase specialized sigma24 family protein